VYADGGEVGVDEELVEAGGPAHRLHKDAHLVELEGVQELDQLAVLFILCQLDKVLLQPV
jgi:hypothetical protein